MENMLDEESVANILAQLVECYGLWEGHLFSQAAVSSFVRRRKRSEILIPNILFFF